MTTSAELLIDHFGRVDELVHDVLDRLTEADLARRPEVAGSGGPGNPIGWLVWHLLRVQDDHVAEAFGTGQVWTGDGWADRFGLDLDPADTGFGHTPEQVGRVRTTAELLTGYGEAVHARTVAHLGGLGDDDLSRILPSTWGEGVSLGVRLVSVLGDDLQHAGQAAYLRGLFGV
ncbi:chorismate synthase [Pseudonocardia sp. EC080610-09]|uniref:mycothiol transferase n=1 Tax=unclassified Pseudonocardia TaxID=2619320 RepID=UPI0006CB3ECF|nr:MULTISPECIES: DinB family protein [unclassified Pseudonocardia]ALE73389.1 chorismate synthase [Pseudonocardia sp. EC080625-04]ALL77097.1 chorismate synthase [Pseudonocardia sp. EC080610-09]ALL80010.1 chorismate synthase [Pseudonocardia sp. EC080619-01]